jgi:HEPN domain-containing protein
MVKQSRRGFWLRRIGNKQVHYAWVCYHFHQAAENTLKPIVANDLEFQKIHDLPVLLKTCTGPCLQKSLMIASS